MTLLPIFVFTVFFYALFSKRFEKSVITAPMLFTASGALVFLVSPEGRGQAGDLETYLGLSETALVMLLFADASRANLHVLRDIGNLATRLLSVGMLLTITLGIAVAGLVLPELSWWEAGILSAILAPTDASLGMVIVNSDRVPTSIRQSLNVEAGLNDGLSVPFMLFFIALAAAGPEGTEESLFKFVVEQLGYGAIVGVLIGLLGGALLGWAAKKQWMQESMNGLGVVVLPVLCLVTCEPLGASAFIASFVAGLAAQIGFPAVGRHSVEFTEEWGQVLSLGVFFLFGLFVAGSWNDLTFATALYAILSLTVVRMLPVALALAKSGLSLPTKLFMGWFGPRGLASIVLGLVFLEHEVQLPGEPILRTAIVTTVMLSIFAHGASAIPGINWYARKIAALSPEAPERSQDS